MPSGWPGTDGLEGSVVVPLLLLPAPTPDPMLEPDGGLASPVEDEPPAPLPAPPDEPPEVCATATEAMIEIAATAAR
jgi:hypothetical protein